MATGKESSPQMFPSRVRAFVPRLSDFDDHDYATRTGVRQQPKKIAYAYVNFLLLYFHDQREERKNSINNYRMKVFAYNLVSFFQLVGTR